ncbi:MAG: hypothetical protein Fur007_18270 [Rhodoferax sp.]
MAQAQTEILLPRPIGFSGADLPQGAVPVAVNTTGLFALALNAQAQLSLQGQLPLAVVHDRVETHASGNKTWIGYLRDYGKDYRVILTIGDAASTGRILTPNGEYWLITQAGQTWVQNPQAAGVLPAPNLIDDGLIPNVPPSSVAPASTDAPTGDATPTPQSTVDVMVLYTPSLATQLGAGVQARLDQLIAISNQAYIDSEVAITLRLVHTEQVAYSDSTDNLAALNALTDASDASLSSVPTLRNTYGADLVVLMRAFSHPTQTSCGVGWVGGYHSGTLSGYSAYGYSVVSNGSSNGYYCDELTFAHELGHNMGNVHDHRTASAETAGVFSYSFGHGVDNAFVSVMAYPSSFTNAPRIGKFSNPSLLCNGQPCGVSNVSDTARSMNTIRDQVAAYRAAPVSSYALTVSKSGTGSGTVTSSPTGIDCGATCSASFSSGTSVTLTATPASGSSFAGWSGACSGTGTCAVTMSAAQNVTATFSRTVPSAPTNVTVTTQPGRAIIAFTVPTDPGASAITGYTASCSAAGQTTRTGTSTGSPITVYNLTPGVVYSCSVVAQNAQGTGDASAAVAVTGPKRVDMTPILMLLLD